MSMGWQSIQWLSWFCGSRQSLRCHRVDEELSGSQGSNSNWSRNWYDFLMLYKALACIFCIENPFYFSWWIFEGTVIARKSCCGCCQGQLSHFLEHEAFVWPFLLLHVSFILLDNGCFLRFDIYSIFSSTFMRDHVDFHARALQCAPKHY